MVFKLTSPAFAHGAEIPLRFTRDGDDVSPPLAWTDPPNGSTNFVLVCEDPDAPRGIWTHWVIFDLPADLRELEEGIAPMGPLPHGIKQGKNDFSKLGYCGPSPPPGKPHRYYFRLLAIDCPVRLSAAANRGQVLAACKGHVLAEAQLMGTYGR